MTTLYLQSATVYFAQKAGPGGFLALGLLLALYGPGLGPDGPGCPGKPETNPVLHAEQPFLQQLSQKTDS